jgi:hypothetical protein
MWKNKERSVDSGGVFGLSIIKHVTLQKIVAHDFQYNPVQIKCTGLQDSITFALLYKVPQNCQLALPFNYIQVKFTVHFKN